MYIRWIHTYIYLYVPTPKRHNNSALDIFMYVWTVDILFIRWVRGTTTTTLSHHNIEGVHRCIWKISLYVLFVVPVWDSALELYHSSNLKLIRTFQSNKATYIMFGIGYYDWETCKSTYWVLFTLPQECYTI